MKLFNLFIFFTVYIFVSGLVEAEHPEVFDAFIQKELIKWKDVGPKHPIRIRLEDIANEKDESKAMQKTLTYLIDENHRINTENKKILNNIKYHSIRISNFSDFSNLLNNSLAPMIVSGAVFDLSIKNQNIYLNVRSESHDELIKIITNRDPKCLVVTTALVFE